MGGRGRGWVVAKAKKEARGHNGRVLSSYDIHMHPQMANIPLQGLGRLVLTAGVILSLHCQIGALHWHHFTRHGFTWSRKKALWRSKPVDISHWRQ